MNDLEYEDEQLESLMQRHLSVELNSQLGRSEAAFRQHVRATAKPPVAVELKLVGSPPRRPGHANRFGGWFFGVAGAALAASVAALFAAPAIFRSSPPASHPPVWNQTVVSPAASGDSPMMHYIHSRTWDEGTVNVGGPARVLRRQQVEQSQWYDPEQRARLRVTVPREDVELQEMDTY